MTITNQKIYEKLEEISINTGCKGKECNQYKNTKVRLNIFTLFIAILIAISCFGYGKLEAFKTKIDDGIKKDFQEHIIDYTQVNEAVKQNTKDINKNLKTRKEIEELMDTINNLLDNMEK